MKPVGSKKRKNRNNNRLSFDASKTWGCKPARTVREGCGGTELGVCSFVMVPTLKKAAPPHPRGCLPLFENKIAVQYLSTLQPQY